MRYVRLFLLHTQEVFEYRSIAVVWFLVSIINPLLYLMFWRGALVQSSGTSFTSVQDVNNYYIFYVILSGFLMAHVEHDVAYWDIKEGGLIKYILKPLPYFVFKFFFELTWRITMGIFAVITTLLIIKLFGPVVSIELTQQQIIFVIVSCILALFISFVFKMIIGLTALWVVDFGGIEQLVFVITLLFSGFIVPLNMFPGFLQAIAFVLPIPYMIYYPIQLLQGKLSFQESVIIVVIQVLWLVILLCIYKIVWQKGVKRFSGVGL